MEQGGAPKKYGLKGGHPKKIRTQRGRGGTQKNTVKKEGERSLSFQEITNSSYLFT